MRLSHIVIEGSVLIPYENTIDKEGSVLILCENTVLHYIALLHDNGVWSILVVDLIFP